MNTLDQAWGWYDSTRVSLKLIHRLGDRYWNELPWQGALRNDSRFDSIDGPLMVENRAKHSSNSTTLLYWFSFPYSNPS
jgi:hypothetical protein